MKETIKSGKRN